MRLELLRIVSMKGSTKLILDCMMENIHEIHPIKFGGSPTDLANKIALSPEDHYAINAWWGRLQRNVQTGKVNPGKDK
jgi:hypothetical protein